MKTKGIRFWQVFSARTLNKSNDFLSVNSIIKVILLIILPFIIPLQAENFPNLEVFPITFWWGPPPQKTNLSRYKQIASAGFNIANFPSPNQPGIFHPVWDKSLNKKILGLCDSTGLKAIINDRRINKVLKIDNEEKWQSLLKETVEDYKSDPALYAYFIKDEPTASLFQKIGKINTYIKKLDKEHPIFVNLLPNYAPQKWLDAKNYQDYLEKYVKIVQPEFICYDHYNLMQNNKKVPNQNYPQNKMTESAYRKKDRPGFYQNLEAVRKISDRYSLPFMIIVLLTPHGPYRDPNLAELQWEVFQSLAYGADGIAYFTYWTPPDTSQWNFRKGAITYHGNPTVHYQQIKQLNSELALYGNILKDLKFDTLKILSDRNIKILDLSLEKLDGGNVTVTLFGKSHIFIANRNYQTTSNIQIYNPQNMDWQIVRPAGKQLINNQSLNIRLDPGDATLLKKVN